MNRMNGKLSLATVTDMGKWDTFVESSLEGTIFSSSAYLNALNRRYELFYILKGSEIRAGISLILSEDGSLCELDDLVIYKEIFHFQVYTTNYRVFCLITFH